MGTTDNFDSGAASSVAAGDKLPIIRAATGRAATATVGQHWAGQNLSRSVSTIGSSATNTTQTLFSYSMPGSTLTATNPGITVMAFGRKAANAAGVTFQLNVGGQSINTGNITTSGPHWILTADAWRASSNNQQEFFTAQVGTAFTTPKSTSDTSVDTSTITISVQILDASAAQSNVLLDGFVVEYFG